MLNKCKIEGIIIGKCVHVAAYYSLQRAGKFVLVDFSGLSSRVAVYSSSDDYCGQVMTNPSVPQRYENLHSGPVTLRKYVIIDVNSCILSNVEIGYGPAIGAFSLVSENIGDFTIVVGVPAKPKLYRKQNFVELEKQFLNSDLNQK